MISINYILFDYYNLTELLKQNKEKLKQNSEKLTEKNESGKKIKAKFREKKNCSVFERRWNKVTDEMKRMNKNWPYPHSSLRWSPTHTHRGSDCVCSHTHLRYDTGPTHTRLYPLHIWNTERASVISLTAVCTLNHEITPVSAEARSAGTVRPPRSLAADTSVFTL